MTFEEIRYFLTTARQQFLDQHFKLLEMSANERSLTHKFAECLTPLFDAWDVDCEYNRDGHEPKVLSLNPESIASDDEEGVTVYPDIIVHHRKESGPENNLLVIEAKKRGASGRSKDIEKLLKYKQELHYQFAVFLEFFTGESYDIRFEFI